MTTKPAPTSATTDTGPETSEAVLYEVCVLHAVLQQKEEQVLLKNLDELFAEAGGKLVAKDAWGLRGIAYPMQGQTEGHYIVYHYEFPPSTIKELDRNLRIEKNVLRHLIVKPPKGYQIVKWSEKYEQWLKERETLDQKRVREEEAKLQEKVAARARVQAKRAEEQKRKKVEAPAKPMVEGELEEKLEKLISDDTLGL